jgi:hypothetical protein
MRSLITMRIADARPDSFETRSRNGYTQVSYRLAIACKRVSSMGRLRYSGANLKPNKTNRRVPQFLRTMYSVVAATALTVPVVAAGLKVVNHDFESDNLQGWRVSQHAGPKAYHFSAEAEPGGAKNKAARVVQYEAQFFGALTQTIKIPDTPAKYRVSARMRSIDATDRGWVLSATAHSESGRYMNSVEAPPLRGTTPWQHVSLDLAVDAGATSLSISAALGASGKAEGWLDDVQIEVIEP